MSIYNNFWVRVSKEQRNFTKKEKVLINYITNNSQDMNNVTISALSKANNVGYSVVYNLIKKLGFKGYREFIISIAAEESTYKALNQEFFGDNNFLKETYHRLLDLNDATIDNHKLQKFVVWLNENRESTFYVTGVGQSALGAEDLTFKLYCFGLKAFCLNKDDDNILMHCSILQKDDILIIFSLSGKTETIIKAAQIAKANGVKIIVITSQEKSTLADYADWLFTIIFTSLYDKKSILISPLFAMAYFNDLIVVSLLELPEKEWYLNNRSKTNKVIRKLA